MTDSNSAKIDKYLLGEMSDAEHENFEAQMMLDDPLFYSVADRENDLVDDYVRNTLHAKDAQRFRRSLAKFPARQQKVASAKLLGEYIAEGQASATLIGKKMPWYRRLGFTFQAPAVAMASLALLFVAAIGFLLIQNRGLQNDVASLQRSVQVDELKRLEAELQSQLENERLSTGDLTTDLESERERRAKLEAEIEDLRKKVANTAPTGNKPLIATIATITLRPVGSRGQTSPVRNLELSPTQKRVSVRIVLPSSASGDRSFNVLLNGETAARSVTPSVDQTGARSLTFSVPADRFNSGMNKIVVSGESGNTISEFSVITERK